MKMTTKVTMAISAAMVGTVLFCAGCCNDCWQCLLPWTWW